MNKATEKAWIAWQRAVEKSCRPKRDHTISRMEKDDATIRRLKARYEELLLKEKRQ